MDSFLTLNHVFVEYEQPISLLHRMTGGQTITHSVLRDISLQTPQGSHITVFGKPAAGKTTLLRLLTGIIRPARGHVMVNGKPAGAHPQAAAGYVASEEEEAPSATAAQSLQAFIDTHHIEQGSARLGVLEEVLGLSALLHRPVQTLSVTERLKINMAKAFVSDAPVILLDDVADELGPQYITMVLTRLGAGRTILISTRSVATAEALELPVVLLNQGSLAHTGTCESIADSIGCPRLLKAWVEGLRYDVLRRLKKYPGVAEVRLVSADQFAGQCLKITLHSSSYLPGVYDILSQTELVRVEEVPPTLQEIVSRL